MHSLPLRSLTEEAPGAYAQPLADSDTSLPSALSGTTWQLPHPRQPCLAILRNLSRIVVGYNDHMREESYNHYILAMKKVADGFSPRVALNRRSHKPLHKQIINCPVCRPTRCRQNAG